jgi:double zinc ribbon protein
MAGCPACDAPIDLVDRFCGRCGSGLAGVAAIDPGLSRFCHGCGGSLQPDARFCRGCGAQAPDPAENVFAGMALNGHDVVTITEPVADLVAHTPQMRIAGPERPRIERRPVSPRPTNAEARTESIPRPAPRMVEEAPVETAPRRPRSRPTPRVRTATIERTPVQRATVTPEPAPAEAPGTDVEELGTVPPTGFPWGGTLALLGALMVILSAIVDWGGPFSASLPRDISSSRLLDPTASSGPSLGLILLLFGTFGALVTLVGMAAPGFTFLRRFIGVVTLMFPIGFALRTVQALAEESRLSALFSTLGVGVAMAAAGGFLQLVARRPRRHR